MGYSKLIYPVATYLIRLVCLFLRQIIFGKARPLVINNIQQMSLLKQPLVITPRTLCSPADHMSPMSLKSSQSESTNYSEEDICSEIKEGQKKLSQNDPYFISLLRRDKQFKLTPYFLANKDINLKMRSRLIKWMQQLIQQYEFKLQTYFTAVSILDKYLENSTQTSKDLQLIGCCALYLSSKIHQTKIKPPEIYVYSSGDCFNILNMLEKEKQILKALNFNICFPHVTRFIKILGGLTKAQFQQSERILIMLQQSIENYQYSRIQLAKIIIYLVKSEFQVTSINELFSEIEKVQNSLHS